MTYHYANPPKEATESVTIPIGQVFEKTLLQKAWEWNHWVVSSVVATLLVAMFAGIMYLLSPGKEDAPVTINIPAMNIPVQATPTAVPGFAEFAGLNLPEVVQDAEDGKLIGFADRGQPIIPFNAVPYSPSESCVLFARSLEIDPVAREIWQSTVPEEDKIKVAQSCGWEVQR